MQPVAIGTALQAFLNAEQGSKPKAGGRGEDVYWLHGTSVREGLGGRQWVKNGQLGQAAASSQSATWGAQAQSSAAVCSLRSCRFYEDRKSLGKQKTAAMNWQPQGLSRVCHQLSLCSLGQSAHLAASISLLGGWVIRNASNPDRTFLRPSSTDVWHTKHVLWKKLPDYSATHFSHGPCIFSVRS